VGESIIIELPALQTQRQRLLLAVITGIFWAAWCYLWLPVVSVIEWAFGLPNRYQAFVLHGYSALQEVLPVYCGVISLMGGSLIAWATYNMLRFKGSDRRSGRADMDLDVLADFHAVQPAALARWQEARLLVLDHDESGDIASVTLLSTPGRGARRGPDTDEPSSTEVTYVVRNARSPRPPFGNGTYVLNVGTS